MLKAYRVETTGFEENVSHVAAKSAGSARLRVAHSMADNYYQDMRKMGHCLSQVKSVRRAPEHDGLIDQRRTAARFIHPEAGEQQ